MNKRILSLAGIAKSYKTDAEQLDVLVDVNLELAEGESIAVMGASGCGKSTLLNLIGGLDKSDRGEINSCGYPVSSLDEKALTRYRSDAVGFIFQFHYLLKDFSALENVMLPMLMQGKPKEKAREAAMEHLERIGIADRCNHYPSQLSGGERQRAAFARAMINDPRLILADEPTGNLDERHKARVADLIFSMIAETRKSLVLVTHALDMAKRANKIFTLSEGRLLES